MYQPIDQVKTGIKLKMLLKVAGYDVKYIQEYLHLSCSQSIYRWFKGKVLPSLEHLCALSKLLNVHIERQKTMSTKKKKRHPVFWKKKHTRLSRTKRNLLSMKTEKPWQTFT